MNDTTDAREKTDALLPEDREFLERHGWHDTWKDYPPIGTERILE